MYRINIKARAKINISLDVIGKREDGYHDVKMIMQTINLYDKINIKKIRKDEIKIQTNLSFLPVDERNLVYKVIKYLKEKYKIKTGVFVDLYKVIPVAAGLAGGSSDAAATLVGMNKLFNLRMSMNEMMEIGTMFGADIPYCLLRGTALSEGIGEKLTSLGRFPDAYVVIAKPGINVSTGFVYGNLDLSSIDVRPDTDKIIEGIDKGDLHQICNNMGNILETVTIKKYPVINEIKDYMMENGAIGSLMTGSGPSVFGILEDKHKAYNLAHKLKVNNIAKFVYTTTIFNS
ncbi:4-(cytidine 5'-diphospho)-2-C-methyl-D-erythritol kinase [Vallitalea guaymasensis]|uniref:4-diphosphocytidyl-2-C-methyl-D-erythritol kinase n=1 Tax=Vallitalea guaymasensis TaxID=1185412 RepID=A0A8J8SC42_9FIRM|nr:4-(cytidine 5'-diphospho)-2-C-methyl-D-erythritol kinase [Vallitalea guaymasensis]QUH29050.1 4-(cytidine 5'-diphospho)-2-C-methyl-D-erythritol kinase [Vallitalea guaymasensis]